MQSKDCRAGSWAMTDPVVRVRRPEGKDGEEWLAPVTAAAAA